MKFIFTSKGLETDMGRSLIEAEIIKDLNLGEKKIALFIKPYTFVNECVVRACIEMGFNRDNIFLDEDASSAERLDYVYVTSGNTFSVLQCLKKSKMDVMIKDACLSNCTYIGSSAGVIIAADNIFEIARELSDQNYVKMTEFDGLGLLKDTLVIPHYNRTQLRKFLKATPTIADRYEHIYYLGNDQVLVIDEKKVRYGTL